MWLIYFFLIEYIDPKKKQIMVCNIQLFMIRNPAEDKQGIQQYWSPVPALSDFGERQLTFKKKKKTKVGQ